MSHRSVATAPVERLLKADAPGSPPGPPDRSGPHLGLSRADAATDAAAAYDADGAQKERTTHHDDQDCDHDLCRSCEHHATPAASRDDRFGGPALVLPDQRLHELPRARSRDRGGALPDLRVRPPDALARAPSGSI